MTQVIKILSGTTDSGGSTYAHLFLTNLLNEAGYDTTLWGPQDWHLNKCRGGILQDCRISSTDILISHFIHPDTFNNVQRKLHVLSIHEKELFPLKYIDTKKYYDKIHYVSQTQKDWHDVDHNYFICHPLIDSNLKLSETKPTERVAGIIGSIDRNKQTHISIKRALSDGHTKIKLFGKYVLKDGYYEQCIQPFITRYPNIIEPLIHTDDKQAMYDSVTDVYLSSKSETWSYIRGECEITGTRFHGTPEIELNFPRPLYSREEILKIWEKELGL